MNNDLISREDLKAILQSKFDLDKDDLFVRGYNIGIEAAIEMLDNAEPIDMTKSMTCPNCDSGYAQGYSDGYLKGKEERPHGKWIKIFENPFTNGYVCPFCGHKIQVTEQFLPKVTECEVCGAKMDKEADNDNK